jgi:MFS family permease
VDRLLPAIGVVEPVSTGARLRWVIMGNGVLRVAGGASTVLVGAYLADLNARGVPMSAAIVGGLAATSFGAELLGAIPLGVLSDFVPVRVLMSAGAMLAGIATLTFRFTHNVHIFIASRVLEGLAAAVSVPPMLAYLTDITATDAPLRARAMSYFELSLLTGLAFGGIIASRLWTRFSVDAFTVLSAAYLAAAAFLLMARTTRHAWTGAELWRSLGRSLARPSVRRLAPVWLCVNAVIGLWLGPTFYFLLTRRPTTAQWLDGLFTTNVNGLGWLLLVYAFVFSAGLVMWSRLLPRMDLRGALRLCLLAMLGVCAALVLVNHMATAPAAFRWMMLGGIAVLIMVESGFTPAALSLLAASIGPTAGRGGITGLYSFLLSLGALIGSVLAGVVGERYAIDGLIGVTIVFAALALALSTRLRAEPSRMFVAS